MITVKIVIAFLMGVAIGGMGAFIYSAVTTKK